MVRKLDAFPVTVPMRYMREMVAAATVRGMSIERALACAGGLEARMLDAQNARVSLPQFSRLYGALVLHTGDEGAGLSSRPIAQGAVESMCRVGITTSTLAEAVEALSRALNAMVPGVAVRRAGEGGGFAVQFREIDPIAQRRQTTYEVLLLTVYAVLSWLVGCRPALQSADVPYAAPRHRLELRTLFAGPIRFNQSHAALRFAAEQGGLPVVRVAADLPKLLRRAPGSLVDTLLHGGGLSLAVRKRLHAALPVQPPIGEVAAQLSMSARTLHRRLVAEGTSFQEVRDALRRDVAIHALTRTGQPLKKIAELVGFRDQSSFQRAFLQWTGRSPGMMRSRSVQAA